MFIRLYVNITILNIIGIINIIIIALLLKIFRVLSRGGWWFGGGFLEFQKITGKIKLTQFLYYFPLMVLMIMNLSGGLVRVKRFIVLFVTVIIIIIIFIIK